jgi:hypothetical protein
MSAGFFFTLVSRLRYVKCCLGAVTPLQRPLESFRWENKQRGTWKRNNGLGSGILSPEQSYTGIWRWNVFSVPSQRMLQDDNATTMIGDKIWERDLTSIRGTVGGTGGLRCTHSTRQPSVTIFVYSSSRRGLRHRFFTAKVNPAIGNCCL